MKYVPLSYIDPPSGSGSSDTAEKVVLWKFDSFSGVWENSTLYEVTDYFSISGITEGFWRDAAPTISSAAYGNVVRFVFNFIVFEVKLYEFKKALSLLNIDPSEGGLSKIPDFEFSSIRVAANGKGTITLDGALLKSSKNTFSLTVKEADSAKSDSIKVNLKNPKYETVEGVEKIKITSYKLKANDANQTIAKQADGTEKVAKINFYGLSNGYEVGTVSEDKTQLVTDANDLKLTSTTASKGAQYLVVYDPDGKVVKSTDAASSNGLGVRGNDGKYEVVVANGVDPTENATSGALVMKYAKTGTDTVKVLEISSFNTKGEAKFTTKYSASFKVENSNAAIAFKKQESLVSESVEINDIVADTLKFTRGGSDWAYTADMIASVSYVKNESAGRIVVTSITFNVPLNGSSDTAYYVYKVSNINKAIEVPSEFFK